MKMDGTQWNGKCYKFSRYADICPIFLKNNHCKPVCLSYTDNISVLLTQENLIVKSPS